MHSYRRFGRLRAVVGAVAAVLVAAGAAGAAGQHADGPASRPRELPRLRLLALDPPARAIVLAVGEAAARIVRVGEPVEGSCGLELREVLPDRAVLTASGAGARPRAWLYALDRGAEASRLRWLSEEPPAGSRPVVAAPPSAEHFGGLRGEQRYSGAAAATERARLPSTAPSRRERASATRASGAPPAPSPTPEPRN